MVTSFKYLGRVILETEDDWPSLVRNLAWANTVWRRILRVLIREGVTPLVSGFFFKAVIQVVLLFGAETWVVTPCIGTPLGGFQTQWAIRIMGQLPRGENGLDV